MRGKGGLMVLLTDFHAGGYARVVLGGYAGCVGNSP